MVTSCKLWGPYSGWARMGTAAFSIVTARNDHRTAEEDNVIKLLVERDRPPTFDLTNDKEVARHARI